MKPNLTEDFLTVNEVAKILRFHIYTVYNLLRTNRLHGFRVQRRWRIPRSSLEDFMKSEHVKETKK